MGWRATRRSARVGVAVDGYRLGVDFGTSNTVAVLGWPDGRVKPLLFDGSPLLASAVYADPADGLLVGPDAVHAAATRPERFEPHPKRRVDDGTVLLGDVGIPVVDLIAAVLRRVAGEARRVTGGPTPVPVLTCPASWGPERRRLLRTAAEAAGLADARLVAEPVAAAAYFVEVAAAPIPVGSAAVVYDLGAGTFDATVVRRTVAGFDVLASRGLDDAGGLDIDAAAITSLRQMLSDDDAAAWDRLTMPRSSADRRAARHLWDTVRTGKEALSRRASTLLHIPLVNVEAPLGREQLEELAGPIIDRTVEATQAVLDDAGLTSFNLAGLFLVGGGSRLPLAANTLHRVLGLAPIALEQPELVVAEGSLYTHPDQDLPGEPPTVGPTTPGAVGNQLDDPIRVPVPAISAPAPTESVVRITPRRLGMIVALLVLATAGFVAWLQPWAGDPNESASPSTTPATSSRANTPGGSPSTSPDPATKPEAHQKAVATAFANAFLTTDVSAAQWLTNLTPYITTQLSQQLTEVDPESVPAERVTGPVRLENPAPQQVDAVVPADTGDLRLHLVSIDGGWRVDGIDWNRR